MTKRIWFFILISALVSCGVIKRIKLRHNDAKTEQGVSISLLDDYQLKDIEGSKNFNNNRIFISEVFMGSHYSYYIFWNDGRCFYSDARTIDEINLDDILNDKRGTAAYYTLSNDTLCTERYTDGVFFYEYFTLSENKLSQIGDKRRIPFRKWMHNVEMLPNFKLEERYTRPGADSIYFNSDSVALWQPFW